MPSDRCDVATSGKFVVVLKVVMAFKSKWWEKWLARAFHVLLTTGVVTVVFIKETGNFSPIMLLSLRHPEIGLESRLRKSLGPPD